MRISCSLKSAAEDLTGNTVTLTGDELLSRFIRAKMQVFLEQCILMPCNI